MQKSWTIGANDACDIRVNRPYVSGKHCRLEFDGMNWCLEDFGSTNGTFINGVQLKGKALVQTTDRITLGKTQPMPWPAPLPRAEDGPLKSVALPGLGKTIVLGRDHSCDLTVDFPMISSRHASIEKTTEGWLVRDLRSTNGTFVRGRRITEAVPVNPGEVIGLGSHRLTLSADGVQLTELPPRGKAVLEANRVSVKIAEQLLIAEISLVVQSGELIGIMGPSGAGKSTLLATLVGYQQPQQGSVTICGADLYARFDEFRGQIGYVPQDDIMHTDLTVKQALWYSARLRLPGDFTDQEIHTRIAAVIAQLGLSGLEQSRIGSAERRGISGGQRKRVNVAMELLTDPPILVLDEPTSGLSSVDALSLMQLLRRLADAGKTIVLTIHQPSLDVFKLMDGLAVIAKDQSSQNAGQLVWYGPAYPDSLSFFESGTQKETSNRAESVLQSLSRQTVAQWVQAYRGSVIFEPWVTSRQSPTVSPTATQPRNRRTFLVGLEQWWVLVKRMLAVKIADVWGTAVLLLQAPVVALLIAGVFGSKTTAEVNAGNWLEVSTASATTMFLLSLAAIWFGCSNAAREIVSERVIYRRERMAGLSTAAYLASKVSVLGLLCLIQCAVLLWIVGWGCGLVGEVLPMFRVLFLAAIVGVLIGLMTSALARSAEAAAGILPLVILPMVILGGILMPLNELPRAAEWASDLIPSRWAFEGLLVQESSHRPLMEVTAMADQWFPISTTTQPGWRHSAMTPSLVLLAMGMAGILSVHALLIWKESHR